MTIKFKERVEELKKLKTDLLYAEKYALYERRVLLDQFIASQEEQKAVIGEIGDQVFEGEEKEATDNFGKFKNRENGIQALQGKLNQVNRDISASQDHLKQLKSEKEKVDNQYFLRLEQRREQQVEFNKIDKTIQNKKAEQELELYQKGHEKFQDLY